MDVIKTVEEMQRRSKSLRHNGKAIAFVPTMGFFHEGHLELMRVARRHGEVVIISIFVNPIQFGPKEDFEGYPRDREGDLRKARGVGVDLVFSPSVKDIYPEGFQTSISVHRVTQHLCGLSRPGHFDGVTTVVAKLFHIVKPPVAVFGEKDYQQLTIIRRMVKDLNMDIQVVGVPTVRESDGLAMSSRNSYLNAEERRSALCLKRALDLAVLMARGGEQDAGKISSAMREVIEANPSAQIDYIAVCHPETLEDLKILENESLVALAVRIGRARLIDNCLIKKS